MTREQIDHMRVLEPERARRGMSVDLPVGEFLTLALRAGGSDLLFGLQAKTSGLDRDSAQRVDNVKIVLTIESKPGQRARVRVQAPESVRITRPEKVAG